MRMRMRIRHAPLPLPAAVPLGRFSRPAPQIIGVRAARRLGRWAICSHEGTPLAGLLPACVIIHGQLSAGAFRSAASCRGRTRPRLSPIQHPAFRATRRHPRILPCTTPQRARSRPRPQPAHVLTSCARPGPSRLCRSHRRAVLGSREGSAGAHCAALFDACGVLGRPRTGFLTGPTHVL